MDDPQPAFLGKADGSAGLRHRIHGCTDDGDIEDMEVPEVIPVLSLRNTVLFPGVVLPISIARPKSIQLIKEVYRSDKIVGTVAQRDPEIENPKFEELNNIGTIGQIVKLLEMPDGSTTAIIQGKKRMVQAYRFSQT